jgi:hypothetical protein
MRHSGRQRAVLRALIMLTSSREVYGIGRMSARKWGESLGQIDRAIESPIYPITCCDHEPTGMYLRRVAASNRADRLVSEIPRPRG